MKIKRLHFYKHALAKKEQFTLKHPVSCVHFWLFESTLNESSETTSQNRFQGESALFP